MKDSDPYNQVQKQIKDLVQTYSVKIDLNNQVYIQNQSKHLVISVQYSLNVALFGTLCCTI